jgi:hypothetical protein
LHRAKAKQHELNEGQTLRFRDPVPEVPRSWTRRFPVFGAVSGTVGRLAAMETIKPLSGLRTTT